MKKEVIKSKVKSTKSGVKVGGNGSMAGKGSSKPAKTC